MKNRYMIRKYAAIFVLCVFGSMASAFAQGAVTVYVFDGSSDTPVIQQIIIER